MFVLLEPCVHLAELELNEPVEFVVMIHGRSCLRPAVAHDDVVDVVLLRLEGVNEVLVGHVFGLEEEVRVVRLQPAAHSNESAGRQGGMRTSRCSHKKRISGVDDVLAPEEDAHPPGGRLDVREGERERSKGDDAHGGSWTGGVRRSEREEDGEAPGRRWLTDCEGRCRSFWQWLARSNTARLRRRDHVESGRGTRGARKHTCNTNARLASIAFLSLTAASSL